MKKLVFKACLLAGGGILAARVEATGYEKVVLWSGKYSALGGAAASSVQGPQALYFNPAGLGGIESPEVSLQVSPTWVQFKGPALQANIQDKGKNIVFPLGGAFVSYPLNERLGLGLGFYVAGGSASKYTGLDPTKLNAGFDNIGKLENSVKLEITEASLGVGYKLNKNLKVGMAWRSLFVRAAFKSVEATNLVITNLDLSGLKQNKYNGFRFGTQFRPDSGNWGLGLSLRSAVTFNVKGNSSGRYEYTSAVAAATGVSSAGDITGGKVAVKNTFPLQASIGGDFKFTDNWTFFPEYTFSQYSVDDHLEIDGRITVGSTVSEIPSIDQKWQDSHGFRLGNEYQLSENLVLRGAYALTTNATRKTTALAVLATPGIGHTFAVGAGLPQLSENLSLDTAIEYSIAKATIGPGGARQGKYQSRAYAVHLGADYRF